MAIKSLADTGKRFYVLTSAPADPAHPTAAELAAGLDASCKVARENFSWTPTDSDTVDDPELCSTSKAVAPSYDNADLSFMVYRYWLDGGGVDTAADTLFAAIKTKGTVLWGYYLHTDDPVGTAPSAGDEIVLGAEFWTDHPQDPGSSGWLKYRVPCRANQLYPWTTVGPVATTTTTTTGG